jgi:hypothetical protein
MPFRENLHQRAINTKFAVYLIPNGGEVDPSRCSDDFYLALDLKGG